ncbi:hypothetical protein WAC38_29070, partial [Klebsiella pneumoniae]
APLAEKPGWFARVWERVAEEVAKTHQVFVVCAAIDAEKLTKDEVGDEPSDGADTRTRWGVVQVGALLDTLPAFADI